MANSHLFVWYTMDMEFINVYIEQNTMQLNRTFTYKCDFPVQKGARVRVPFNGREYIAIVEEVGIQTELTKVLSVKEVIDQEPLLNEELEQLAKDMSKEYVCSYMACIKTMLPPSLKPKSNHAKIIYEDIVYLHESNEKLSIKQIEFLQSIRSRLPMKASELRKESIHMTKVLLDKGYIQIKKEEKVTTLVETSQDVFHDLTQEQINAIETIESDAHNTFLLHGVTGSGKTEVFLQLAQKVIEQGKQVLFLVPEIGLTPMMINRVSARFGSSIAIYHSQLNEQEKYAQYKLVKDNKVSIVVGTRSAVFMPFQNLGLILMDEEHDTSYKQDNAPRYLTKDIVLKRAKYHNCKVVLSSATPSLDSYARAYKGIYKLVELKKRVFDNVPNIHMIDMKKEQVEFGISHSLIQAIQQRLDRNEQSILLLNRRGYLPVVRCMSCNEVVVCPDCNIAMSFHKNNSTLMCHCCGKILYFRNECPYCKGKDFYKMGMGTEKLEEKIQELFPDAYIVRMDADTTSRKNAHKKILEEFEKKGDILVGTQMVAKGLDFERVTLVGILQADASLVRDDYISSEIAYQMLEQASGRAGRANRPGEVYIQTFDPHHFVMKSIMDHSYRQFFQKEMNYRHLGSYPPYVFMATIIYMDKNANKAYQQANLEKKILSPLKVLGPIEISQRRQMSRYRLVVKANTKEELNKKIWEIVNYHKVMKSNVSQDINMFPMMLEG